MFEFIEKRLFVTIGAVCILSLIGNGFVVLANYLAISKYGNFDLFWFSGLLILPMLAFLGLIPISIVTLFFKRLRKIAVIVLISSLLYLIIGSACIGLGNRVRMYGFKQLAIRSKPLITAIYTYEKKYGHPLEKLDNLVPEFLSKVPNTGMGAYPKYEYKVLSEDTTVADPWELRVFTPLPGINFDEFIYLPSKNYPEKDAGGRYERVEDWAYYHE